MRQWWRHWVLRICAKRSSTAISRPGAAARKNLAASLRPKSANGSSSQPRSASKRNNCVKLILAHATLIDCVKPEPVADASVLIEDGRIQQILGGGALPAESQDVQVIDLKGAYLLPGLWDVHIHPHPDYLWTTEVPLTEQMTLFGYELMAAMTESGITGLRCAGAHHYMDVAWKRAFDSGQYVGPRLFAC